MGLVAVWIYAGRTKRSFGSCQIVAILPILFCGLCLLVAAAEGIICLIMAAPIGLGLSLFGGIVGYLIVGNRRAPINPVATMLVFLSVPLTMGMEKRAGQTPSLFSVTSSIIISAPPEKVWPNVISFSSIPPERDWILRTGVAYPTQARIEGTGVGAIRHCIFTTGEFVEPIEVWDEPRRLRFSVADQPELLTERHKNPNLKQFHFIGIDTDPITLQAIRDGAIDGTIAQNPFAHGYISCALLKYMLDGYKPTKPYQLVDAGDILVTKDNVDTYSQQIAAITEQLKKDLTTKYLTK
jgi:hypothetical protein